MAKQRPAIPLGDCAGGIDAFATSGNFALDAVNVYHDAGFTRRRPAFKSFAAAPVFHLPPGRAYVGRSLDDDPPESLDETRIGYTPSATQPYYVGCTAQFDGIDWGDVIASSITTEANRRLLVEYYSGTAWVEMPFVLDTTGSFADDATTRSALTRNGRIHWHTPTDWALLTVADFPAYWVRFTLVDVASGLQTWAGVSVTLAAPGIRVFKRAAINGIFQLGARGGLEMILAADRVAARGLEQGANLGVKAPGAADMMEMNPTIRWSAGTYGQYAAPNGLQAGAGKTTTNTGTTFEVVDAGVADDIVAPSRLYLVNQLFGTPFCENIVPQVTGSVDSMLTSDATLIEQVEDALEHFLLEVTTTGGGVTAGDLHEIIQFYVLGGVATLLVNPPFAGAPDASARFRVLRPPMKVALRGQQPALGGSTDDTCIAQREYDVRERATSARNIFLGDITDTRLRNPADVFGAGCPVNIEIREPARFNLPAGRQYSSVVHPLGQRIILANGGPLLEYDGRSLSRSKVASPDSPQANSLLGVLDAAGPDGQDPRLGAYQAKFLSSPPTAKYLAVFNGVIVTAGRSDAPNRVQWSAPYDYCDLWPRGFEVQVRDNYGGPITGLAVYYDRLLVYTAKSIHEGKLDEFGRFNFRAVTNSIGFQTHHAVAKVTMGQQDVLIGPTVHGLISYAGGEPTPLIDRWDRVVPGGIDIADLERTSGCALTQSNTYVLALRRRGGPGVRDTLLVHRYDTKQTWQWRCPFGINRVESISLPNGKEALAIGTEDGFVMTLTDGLMDDGFEAIEGRLRTMDFNLAGGRRVNVGRASVTLNDLGNGSPVTVRSYLDRSNRHYSSASIPFSAGQAQYGTAEYGTSSYADDKERTMPVNIPSGTKGRSIGLEIISSDRWKLSNIELEVDLLTASKR